MNIKLPTFEECHEIEREDRTPLEAFVWEHEPSDQVSLDEFRKLLGAVIEAERARVESMQHVVNCASIFAGLPDMDELDGEEEYDAIMSLLEAVEGYRTALAKVPK